MKKIFISSLVLSSILLIGCGGDSDSKDKDNKESVDSVLSKSEAATGVPSGINFKNKTSLRLKQEHKISKMLKVTKQIQKKFLKMNSSYHKEEVYSCSESGTMAMDTEYTYMSKIGTNISYTECLDYDKKTGLYKYNDGSLFISLDETIISETNYSSIPDYFNHPNSGTKANIKFTTNSSATVEDIFMDGIEEEYVDDVLIKKDTYSNVRMKTERDGNIEKMFADGEMEEYEKDVKDESTRFHNLVMKNNKDKKSWFIEGGFGSKIGCFSEYHVYNTKETDWLIESKNNSNEWSSGTLYIDNATYRYSGSNVTVEKQDKKGIFTQQELLDELKKKKNSTDCSSY